MTDSTVSQPYIHALVRRDGTGEVLIDDAAYPVTAPDVDAARAAVLAVVCTEGAVPLGRPVRVDTRDPAGHWQLLVHPDGSVSDADHPDPAPPASPAPEPAQQGQPADSLPVTPRPFTRPRARLNGSSTPQPPTGAQQPPPRTPDEAPEPEPPTAPAHREAPAPEPIRRPTLNDLISTRPVTRPTPATTGWQVAVHHLSGGRISPAPGPKELTRRAHIEVVQRPLSGPKTIVVANPKGGAHKTTATLLIAATFGLYRGGYTLAWDNNETRGTLGWRAVAGHHATAVDLLRDLGRFTGERPARVADLDAYVRSQGAGRFDALASDEDSASAASIDGAAFTRLHDVLARFYRVLVVDTGNNMRASNWQAAIEAADQLVIVSTIREDTAQSAAWLVDALEAAGKDRLVRQAVTVLSAPARTADPTLRDRLTRHFGQLTRAVVDVPHDPALVEGGPIVYDALTLATRDAWLRVTAAVAEGLG